MRFFPSAAGSAAAAVGPARNRWLVAALLAALVAAFLAAPTAFADDDDLRDKRKKVRGQISEAADDLHHSSKKVTRLTRRLESALDELGTAREKLTSVRGRLRTAQAKEATARQQLQAAERRLEVASTQLREARVDVAEQRVEVRATVTELATEGDRRIQALTALLDTGSLEELMISRTAGDLVVDTQFRSLENLQAAEDELADHKAEVKQARNQVREKKQAAEEQVRRTTVLVTRAEATKTRVDDLVSRTSTARRAARTARAEDRRALKRLKAREARIRRQIRATRGGPSYSGGTASLLRKPVDPGYVTSPYGMRTHPIYGYYSLHDGTDFGSPSGCAAPLLAARGGRVINRYFDEVYGHRLYVDIGVVNGARMTLVYNHASGYRVGVGAGVARGDVVGSMGTTGWSTGCHLHFTVLRNGDPVNPENYL